jgi:hypothetical protein
VRRQKRTWPGYVVVSEIEEGEKKVDSRLSTPSTSHGGEKAEEERGV